MVRSKNPVDMRSTGSGKRLTQEVDTVLDLDDLLLDDRLFALVLANLGLETLDASSVALPASFNFTLAVLQALLLKVDGFIQSLKPLVERHKLVIILGNLRDQTGHEVVPPLRGGDVALCCRVPGIAQLPPDVQLPGEVQACHEIGQRIGKVPAGEIGVVSETGSFKRVAAVFVQPPAGPDGDEGKVRPLPRQNLVPGDLDLLIQDLQLQIAGQCLAGSSASAADH